jgi:DNA-binding CsgD family transcriptional regulator
VTTDGRARAAAAVERACATATSVVELCRSVQAAMAPVVPTDRWCGFAVDPSTLFATNGYHDEGVDPRVLPRLLDLEYGSEDTNHLPDLVRSAAGVATISEATGGDPASSARWRDVIVPSGLAHEMRAVFRDGRNAWGALIWLRGPDVRDFDAEESAFVRRVAPTVADGFRRVLVRQHLAHGEDAREAGILLLSGDPVVVRSATDAARHWLEQLDDRAFVDHLPTVIASAASVARARARATTLRARTRAGRWLTVTAEVIDPDRGAPPNVGIVVQPSRPAEIAQIVGAAHGLTPRETDVVLQIAAGQTNQEIARTLQLSPHTVGDHLKRVFSKVGVATRGELTSKLFQDYYLPRVHQARPAGSDGWFLPD